MQVSKDNKVETLIVVFCPHQYDFQTKDNTDKMPYLSIQNMQNFIEIFCYPYQQEKNLLFGTSQCLIESSVLKLQLSQQIHKLDTQSHLLRPKMAKKECTPQDKTSGVQFSRLQHCLESNQKQNQKYKQAINTLSTLTNTPVLNTLSNK